MSAARLVLGMLLLQMLLLQILAAASRVILLEHYVSYLSFDFLTTQLLRTPAAVALC
jgi:hypothetical protein